MKFIRYRISWEANPDLKTLFIFTAERILKNEDLKINYV